MKERVENLLKHFAVSTVTAMILCLMMLAGSAQPAHAQDTAISEENFPDDNFRDYIASYISNNISDCYIVGDAKNRLCNHLLVCFEGVDSESLMFLLDLYDIQVSTGSACNSMEVRPSVVLQEIGLNKKDLFSCVRITLNGRENYKDLKFVCKKIKECVDYLRNM